MLSCSKFSNRWLLGCAALFAVGNAVADPYREQVEFGGFITQGYFYSDENNFNGNSSSGSADFREIAVNAAWRANSNLLLAGQIMSRRAGEVDDGDPRVDYAVLDYRYHSSDSGYAGIKLGRVKNPFGFYNATRDVAFTRPSIVLPQSLYFDRARDLELSADGIMFYGNALLEEGVLTSELIIGRPEKDRDVELAYLNRDWEGEFTESRGLLWRTEFATHDMRWRLGTTLGRFELDFEVDGIPTNPAAPGDGSVNIDVVNLSLQYNLEKWSFTSEYLRQFIEWGSLGGVYALQPKNVSEAIYAQVEYRLNPEVDLVARYDVLYIDRNDRNGARANQLFGRPRHTQFAKDFTLGVGWSPTRNWLFRAEWHHVDGTGWLAVQDNPVDADRERRWNLFALQATYRF